MPSQKNKINDIINEIDEVFGDIPFPNHCGWNAAIAMDDWIDDPIELMTITKEKDIHDKWWNIPSEELKDCYMAQCYLDAKGVIFYLPAYLVLVLNDTKGLSHGALISWLLPASKNSEFELYSYFLERFSILNKNQKNVCLKVLSYIKEHINDDNIDYQQDINDILQHDFWVN